MKTELLIGTMIHRRSKGTDAQQLKNGCRVKLVRDGSIVTLQKHGQYKHNGAIARLLDEDLMERARREGEKSKAKKQATSPSAS